MADAEKKQLGLVFYGDGGCIQSVGVGGIGGHGYTFSYPVESPKVVRNLDAPTDKGYLTKPEIEGSKDAIKAVKPEQYIDVSISLPKDATNNIAEMGSVKTAIKYMLDSEDSFAVGHFLLDSKYVLDGIQSWSKKWEQNNWVKADGNEVANKDLWIDLLALKREAEAKGTTFSWDWVKGHSGILGNEYADDLATKAITASFNNRPTEFIEVSEAQGYRKYNNDRSKLLGNSRWYYETQTDGVPLSQQGHFVYHLGDHGDDDAMLGKKMAESSYSVLFLKEPVPIMETIRQAQTARCPCPENTLIDVLLNNVFKPKIFDDITRFGDLYITKPFVHNDLYTHDKTQLTREVRPVKLGLIAVAALNEMELTLENFIAGNTDGFTVTDLTDDLYVEAENKKKKMETILNPKITPTSKLIKVIGQYNVEGEVLTAPLSLVFGIDIPRRALFASLKESKPKVSLIIKPVGKNAFRYFVIVETEGDYLSWSATHSNLRVIQGASDANA